MFKIKAVILEISSGDFTPQGSAQTFAWSNIKARSVDIADNRILTYRVNVKKAGDLKQYLDKTVELILAVEAGGNSSARLAVVGVASAK